MELSASLNSWSAMFDTRELAMAMAMAMMMTMMRVQLGIETFGVAKALDARAAVRSLLNVNHQPNHGTAWLLIRSIEISTTTTRGPPPAEISGGQHWATALHVALFWCQCEPDWLATRVY